MCTWAVNLFCVFRLENIIYVVWIHWWDNEGIGKMFSHFQCFSLHHGRIERKKNAQLMITKHKGTHRSDRTWYENGGKKGNIAFAICFGYYRIAGVWCGLPCLVRKIISHTHAHGWSPARANKCWKRPRLKVATADHCIPSVIWIEKRPTKKIIIIIIQISGDTETNTRNHHIIGMLVCAHTGTVW